MDDVSLTSCNCLFGDSTTVLCISILICYITTGWRIPQKLKIGNKFFERAEQFRYKGTVLISQNSIHEEIKKRLKSGNACCHVVQNLLCPSLLSKYIKIKIFRTIILPFLLYWFEAWSVTWREEHMLRVFESRVLRRIFGPKRDEITREWRRLQIEELYDPYSLLNIIWVRKSRRRRWAGHVAHMGACGGTCRVLVGRAEGRRPLGRPRQRWEDYITMYLKEVGWGGAWTGLIWLRLGSGSGLAWMRPWLYRCREMQGVCWLCEDLLASQEWVSSMELVTYLVS